MTGGTPQANSRGAIDRFLGSFMKASALQKAFDDFHDACDRRADWMYQGDTGHQYSALGYAIPAGVRQTSMAWYPAGLPWRKCFPGGTFITYGNDPLVRPYSLDKDPVSAHRTPFRIPFCP